MVSTELNMEGWDWFGTDFDKTFNWRRVRSTKSWDACVYYRCLSTFKDCCTRCVGYTVLQLAGIIEVFSKSTKIKPKVRISRAIWGAGANTAYLYHYLFRVFCAWGTFKNRFSLTSGLWIMEINLGVLQFISPVVFRANGQKNLVPHQR